MLGSLTVLTGIVVVELLPAQGVVMMAANGEMLGIILVTGDNHHNCPGRRGFL